MARSKRSRVLGIHPCDETAQVVTIEGVGTYRREVCAECTWRRDAPLGAFPAEAYRHSASTCEDAAFNTFSCHMSGKDKPATCAGFLLSAHAEHSIGVRLAQTFGRIDLNEVRATVQTYDDYREMAVANGVPHDDPALARVRYGNE